MKKVIMTAAFLILCFVSCFISCKNDVSKSEEISSILLEENPVSIIWDDSNDTAEIQSTLQNVEIYSANNRNSKGMELTSKYRLATKQINGQIYSRLDFPAENNVRAKSIVLNENEMIIFDSESEVIEFRIPLSNEVNQDIAFLTKKTINSRVNLDLIKKETKRLSLDVIEDNSKMFILEIPSDFFTSSLTNRDLSETRLSTKISFDVENETVCETEVVMLEEDGTTVTTTSYPVYENVNDEPIKIGVVTVINSENPNLMEGFENVEYFNSVDEIPEISDEDYEELAEKYLIEELDYVSIGNPADLSYEETVVELYSDIEINTVEDSLFKMILK